MTVVASRPRLLMCAPDAYDLTYEINDWMHLENRPDIPLARQQWAELYRVLAEMGAQIELVKQVDNAPDMVFTANAGLVAGDRVLMSNFRHPERQIEVEPFEAWFQTNGFRTERPDPECRFEGEGDALFAGDTLVAGYIKRSDICSHRWLAKKLGVPVLSVELVDGRWYHLDTAFFYLGGELAVFYPGAFDSYARDAIRHRFTTIEVAEEEAARFACNAVVLGNDVVVPAGCPRLEAELKNRDYRVFSVNLSEYLKSGGAAKCLTLFLERPAERNTHAS